MTTARRPNLFLIGAMKAGTTSLHAYLGAHPDIFMSDFKEPSYFCPKRLVRAQQTLKLDTWRGEEHYLRLFEEAGKARWVGESSTNYSKFAGEPIAQSIARFNPEARIIYLMRDPVERTISQYWHHVRLGQETRPIVEALQNNPHYMEVSHYAAQLHPYYRAFPHNQIKTVTFETLARTPREAMTQLYTWLGVDPAFSPAQIGDKINLSQRFVVQKRPPAQQHDPAEIIGDAAAWLGAGAKAPDHTMRILDRHKLDVAGAAKWLRPAQQKQTDALSEMLGRHFDEWTTLYG